MSYNIYFFMSSGLSKPVTFPKGEYERCIEHVEEVEQQLKIKRTKYLDNPIHWDTNSFKDVDDKLLCEIAGEHNNWVRWFYDGLKIWSKKPPENGEEVTPEMAQEFWHGLGIIDVPPERWTGGYYTRRMNAIYEVLRGRPDEGMDFDTFNKHPLTEQQAADVINIFAQYLDHDDRRLRVPKGHDYLASSYDGGYDWCMRDGARLWEDIDYEDCKGCDSKSECSVFEELKSINDEQDE